jgi:outer membrane protein assembly factor BamB
MVTTPAIDPNRQYIYTYGLDGYAHKYQVATGAEVIGGGWPQLATLKPYDEKHGGALALATVNGTSYLYVVHGGYPGDNGDYQGHVTTINLETGTQTVFNAACSNLAIHIPHAYPQCSSVRNAVWARPGVAYDAGTNRVLFATGNGGTNSGVTGGFDWSESILAINPDGTGAAGKPIDSYTPSNWLALDQVDADLGSTAPVILPAPPGLNVAHLGMQGGKDAKLRLVNLANLSGQGGPGFIGGHLGAIIDMPQGGALLHQPAVWTNPYDGSTWTFVANMNGIVALKVVSDGLGNPFLAPQWRSGFAAASPVVANGVVYATGATVRAFNAATGDELWRTPQAGGIHFHSPIVANGEVYVTDSANRLTAFALPAAAAAAGGADSGREASQRRRGPTDVATCAGWMDAPSVSSSFPAHLTQCVTEPTTPLATAVWMARTLAGGDANVPLAGIFVDTGTMRRYDCANAPGNTRFPEVGVNHDACRHVHYLWARGRLERAESGAIEARPSLIWEGIAHDRGDPRITF